MPVQRNWKIGDVLEFIFINGCYVKAAIVDIKPGVVKIEYLKVTKSKMRRPPKPSFTTDSIMSEKSVYLGSGRLARLLHEE